MKLKIFDEATPEKEKELILRLVYTNVGVSLVACNEQGRTVGSGHILRINNDGTLMKFTGISPSLGLQLTSTGRIWMDPDGKEKS